MTQNSHANLPVVSADLLLLHAPAVFDFRDRTDIYFPYLSTSGDVPITPLYEYFPVGFKSLQRILSEQGFKVKILNLASFLLKYPKIDIASLFKAIDVRVLGIDLHWMVHVQGSLEIARLFKEIHPNTSIVFGGISSTYYAQELIHYPYIDMVMRGYDTHWPMTQLLRARGDEHQLRKVENLLWKNSQAEIIDNGYTHLPRSFSCGIDWSSMPSYSNGRSFPIREVVSTQNAGCVYNCGWCGGSRDAYRRIYKVGGDMKTSVVRKSLNEIEREFSSIHRIPDRENYHFYSVGSYNETKSRFNDFLDLVAGAGMKSISYEQYQLTPDDVLQKMAAANPRTTITLSPESHDMRVAKLAGRGVYTPAEMERWIHKALDYGIHQIDIWYFVGMPEQDKTSVEETLDYCDTLLKKFEGQRVYPYVCPMIPFLDPGSTFFEEPAQYGYRIFYQSVEDHRLGMQRASLINRINYETKWLSRSDLIHVGFWAVRRLAELKAKYRIYPQTISQRVCQRIDDALEFTDIVHEIDCLSDARARQEELDRIGDEIRRRNQEIFCAGVSNQAFPIQRDIGGRWFDEWLWDNETLERLGSTI